MKHLVILVLAACQAAPGARVSHETEMEASPVATPSDEAPAGAAVVKPMVSALELEPKQRLLIGTGERVALRVFQRASDGTRQDVTLQATYTVRNPAAAAIDGFHLVGQASLSSVVEASYHGVKSQPVPFTVVAPAFRSGLAESVGPWLEIPLPQPLQLTNAERVTFNYSASTTLTVRVASWHGDAHTFGTISEPVQLAGEGQISIPISPWLRDESWDARSIGLEVEGDGVLQVDQLAVIRPFIYGVNLAWLDGAYGHDFGPSYHNPTWGVGYNPDHIDELLAMSDEMGFRVWRVWVFESCEGLVKDHGIVTGVHDTFWRNFDDFVFTRLPKHNIKVYLMLLGAAHATECPDPSPIVAGTARRAFLDQAMLPFVQRYQESPWVWGFDLANEAEGAIAGAHGNWSDKGVDWDTARDFFSQAAAEACSIAPNAMVSTSSGWHNEQNVAAGLFSGLGFTHLDFHNYDDQGALPDYPALQRHARVLVGESGQASNTWSDAVHLQANITMVKRAAAQTYWGILPWAIEYPGNSNEHSMFEQDSTYGHLVPRPALQALRDWALSRGDLGP